MHRASVGLVSGLLFIGLRVGAAFAQGTPYALPAERATLWNPGITSDPLGGTLGPDRLPARTVVCATLDAATYGNGSQDATAAINAAIATCPAGQVVQLSAGAFRINADYVRIEKSHVVLRGAGAGRTILRRTNGAVMGSYQTNAAMPVVIIGPSRWPHPDETTSRSLTADGVQGSSSVTVADASGLVPGQIVLVDEMTKGAWQALPERNGAPTATRVWAGDRVIWQLHNPAAGEDGPFGPIVSGNLMGDGAGWFMRQDRPVTEIKEIVSIAGNTLTFSDPLHITYRTSHVAQVTGFDSGPAVEGSGVEALTVAGGDDGNVRFENAARCWAKNVENTGWLGEGFGIQNSYRVVVRDSYIHDGAWPEPGGGGYALSLSNGTSETLIENNISLNVNKVMVARSCGAGSVVGYNYMDNGLILSVPGWVEAGINGSHMVGPHHMLFEGNYSFNADSDATWGSSIYHTFFRNHLSGHRLGGTVLGVTLEDPPDSVSVRCAGLAYGSRWMSFVGNVLGRPGQMDGWAYEQLGDGAQGDVPYAGINAVWLLGYEANHWEQDGDPQVLTSVIRDGNYDFLTDGVHWHSTPGFTGTLPASLYLTAKPTFFGASPWPWVDPLGTTKLHTLPAQARFDAGTPNGESWWLSVSDVSVVESNTDTVTAGFTVALSAAAEQEVTVDFATQDGTAVAGSDYDSVSGTLTFAPGVTTRTVSVLVNGDTAVEPNETFALRLSNAVNAYLAKGEGVATIVNDDPQPQLQLSVASASVGEAAGVARVAVVRTGAVTLPVTVEYATTDEGAVAGEDYVSASGTLTFEAGETTRTLTIMIVGDREVETNEGLTVQLSDPSAGASLGSPASGTLTIVDDDVPGVLTLATSTLRVDEGAGTATITVRRASGAGGGVTVDYRTADGTATAGSDYVSVAGALTFAAGQTSATITVPILDDVTGEANETLHVALSNPTHGARLGLVSAAVLTIQENERVLQLATSASRTLEGATQALVTVSRSGLLTGSASIEYVTSDGTALAGLDYQTRSGTLTFGANVLARTIAIPVVNDTLDEDDEVFLVRLRNPVGGALGARDATSVTITDNDAGGVVQLGLVGLSVAENRGALTVSVQRTGGAAGGVTVDYATSDGTATAGADYTSTSGTLTFGPGVLRRTFVVPVREDSEPEGDETITLTLSNPTGGARLGPSAVASSRILDNERTFEMGVAEMSVVEGVSARLLVRRTGSLARAVTGHFTTSSGTASEAAYSTTSGTLTFGSGVGTRALAVRTTPDTLDEGAEMFTVALDSPSRGMALARQSHTIVTIEDDDPAGGVTFGTPASVPLSSAAPAP